MPNADDITWPKPWLANFQLAMNPRRSGMCSTRNAVELPNSPPAENPCIRRAARTAIGARMPMVSKVGMMAIKSVPMVIRTIEIISEALRPWRSA